MADVSPPSPPTPGDCSLCTRSPAAPSAAVRSPSISTPPPIPASPPVSALPPAEVGLIRATSRAGRRPTFTPSDDLIVVREMAAAKAHVARFRDISKSFESAARQANANPNLSTKVTGKRLQDRFKRVLDGFQRKDAGERRMSGIGGEVGELDQLLEKNDIVRSREEEKAARSAKELQKEAIGLALVDRAMRRRGATDMDSDSVKVGDADDDSGTSMQEIPRVARRGKGKRVNVFHGESGLAELGLSLREADLAHVEVEKERLGLERERLDMEKAERVADREMRKEEREAHEQLELEKFKLMMIAFAGKKKDSKSSARSVFFYIRKRPVDA